VLSFFFFLVLSGASFEHLGRVLFAWMSPAKPKTPSQAVQGQAQLVQGTLFGSSSQLGQAGAGLGLFASAASKGP
jgi:hypothetical protein